MTERADDAARQRYDELYRRSLDDRETFWLDAARRLDWTTPPDRALELREPPTFAWFPGGRTNLSTNALDRHVEAGRGDATALIALDERGGRRSLTYRELLDEVELGLRASAARPGRHRGRQQSRSRRPSDRHPHLRLDTYPRPCRRPPRPPHRPSALGRRSAAIQATPQRLPPRRPRNGSAAEPHRVCHRQRMGCRGRRRLRVPRRVAPSEPGCQPARRRWPGATDRDLARDPGDLRGQDLTAG